MTMGKATTFYNSAANGAIEAAPFWDGEALLIEFYKEGDANSEDRVQLTRRVEVPWTCNIEKDAFLWAAAVVPVLAEIVVGFEDFGAPMEVPCSQ
jgi:hypothetical protein